jgi:hypothetical protein
MAHVMNTYKRLPVAFERGEGCWLWDKQGKRYLDALAGIAVVGIGHSHPRFVQALTAQAAKLVHTSNIYEIEHQEALGERLAAISGIRPLVHDPRATVHGYHIYMFRYDEEGIALKRDVFFKAIAAEGIPGFGGYAFPLYKTPLFLNKTFINGSFPLGTQYHDDLDYGSFAEKCPVAERACRSEAVWLAQNLLLGTQEDMHDIASAVEKVLDHKHEIA